MAAWRPTISKGAGPLHEELANALEADIGAGLLLPGTQLPTHRELAYSIGVGIGSVTRAYTLAIQRGLIEAHVGRGSFVADRDAPRARGLRSSDRIDLARNVPPSMAAERRIAETFGRLRRRADLLEHLAYPHPAGMEVHRRAGANWLQRTSNFERSDWQKLLITSGAQEGMSIVFSTIAGPGETIMVEEATYFGIKSLSQQNNYQLQPVRMDSQGITPDSLDKVASGGARILYVMPTLQNPTGRTMGQQRRTDIVRIARAHKLWIVEDDIYSPFASRQKVTPLAALLPDQTFYISSLSKVLSPGLRVGFISAPSQGALQQLLETVRARCYAPATLGALIATEWIESGVSDDILREVRAEVCARMLMAKRILGDQLDSATSDECPHVWLPMSELQAERLTSQAMRAGIEVTPASAPNIYKGTSYGMRLCIGGIRERSKLEEAFLTISGILSERRQNIEQGVI